MTVSTCFLLYFYDLPNSAGSTPKLFAEYTIKCLKTKINLDLQNVSNRCMANSIAEANPEIFAGGGVPLKILYFCKSFCTIFPFSLIALKAASHHVLFQNKFLYTGSKFSHTRSQKTATGDTSGCGGGVPSHRRLGVALGDFAIFLAKIF